MDKKPAQLAIALVLYPLLYVLALWALYGDFPPNWFKWYSRNFFIGAVVLGLLWVIPMRSLIRAILYVVGMSVGGALLTIWGNRKGLSSPEFGWDGMIRLIAYSQHRYVGCALVILFLLWVARATIRPPKSVS